VKLRVTRFGFKATLFYGVVLFVHVAASYSNLFFLLLCFATSLGVVAWAATVRNLRRAGATVHPFEPVPEGTAPRLHAKLHGEPVAARVEVRLASGAPLDATLPRGVHPVRDVRLTSSWPTGLFRAIVPLDPLDPVVVYPAPEVPGSPHDPGGVDGEDGAVSREGLAQPSGLREYRPGDPLRRIRWPAMARRGEPVVAVWEAGAGEGYEFVLDRRADEDGFARALRRLAGHAHRARSEKLPLTLHAQEHVGSYGPGHRSWDALWTYLAGVQALPPDGAAPPVVGNHVVRVSG
jgi:uncharacterized protein (DUF58 family)